MRLIYVAALIILLNSVYAYGFVINEIMYNPLGSDTDHEWVELYNNDTETYNLTGWKLRTENTDHSLNIPPENNGQGTMLLQPDSYMIIAQNATAFLNDYTNYTGTVIDSSWPDLSNSAGKTIIIKNSSTVFDNVTYVTNVSEGNTFCRLENECTPTPGKLNAIVNTTNGTITNLTDVRLEVYINNAKVNISYTSLFKISIDNKTCNQLDNVTVEYNITPSTSSSFTREVGCENYTATGSWTPSISGNYTICGAITSSTTNNTNMTNDIACKVIEVTDMQLSCSLSVNLLSTDVVNSSQTLNYNIFVNDNSCNQTSHDIVVEYWIEDMFGYYAKERINTTQTMICSKNISRQWTPDDISGTEGYKIFAKLVSSGCTDGSQSDDEGSKIIVVRGTSQQDSSMEITSISNNEVKYGEDINVNLYVYRNSTNKYSVDVWIRKNENKVSEVTTFHAKSKNTKYNLTLPVRIKPNCDGTYVDGTYTVFAEGLDKNSTRNITIKGISSAFCKTIQVSSGGGGSSISSGSATAVVSGSPMELISYPETVYIDKEFEITVKVNYSVKKPFSIYSYVYKGNNPVSGAWTKNKIEVTENLSLITLKNTVEKGTEPGIYNLRIRLKTDKEEDITKELYVAEEQVKIVNNTINVTSNNKTPSIQKENKTTVTGLIVSKSSEIKKHAVLIYLLTKLKLPRLF